MRFPLQSNDRILVEKSTYPPDVVTAIDKINEFRRDRERDLKKIRIHFVLFIGLIYINLINIISTETNLDDEKMIN